MNTTSSSTRRGLYYQAHERPHALSTVIVLTCTAILLVSCTLIGNTLVCLAVVLVRKLRSQPANYLLVSLAVADLCVGVFVMPLAFFYLILGRWPFGQFMCDAWTSADVTLCTASILSLCAISVDRYSAITRPLTYGPKRTSRRMLAYVILVWVLAVLVSFLPPIAFWKPSEDEKCMVTDNMVYQIYATVASFYMPATIILAVNYKIFQAARRLTLADKKASAYASNSTSFTKYLASGHGRASSSLMSNNIVPLHASGSLTAGAELSNQAALCGEPVAVQSPPLCELPAERNISFAGRNYAIEEQCDNLSGTRTRDGDKKRDNCSLTRSASDQSWMEMIDAHATDDADIGGNSKNSNSQHEVEERAQSSTSVRYPFPIDNYSEHQPAKGSRAQGSSVSYHFERSALENSFIHHDSPCSAFRVLYHFRPVYRSITNQLGVLAETFRFRRPHRSCCQKQFYSARSHQHQPGEHSAALHGRIRMTENGQSADQSGHRCKNGQSPQHRNRGLRLRGRLRKAARRPNTTETRAVKTLGLIIGCFLLCWIPFFTVTLIRAVFCSKHCFIPSWLESLVLWLGYANSTLNPLLYAKFNKDFRTPFCEMLCCRFRTLQSVLRKEEYLENFGDSAPSTSDGYVAVATHTFGHNSKISGCFAAAPSLCLGGGAASSSGSASIALLCATDEIVTRDVPL